MRNILRLFAACPHGIRGRRWKTCQVSLGRYARFGRASGFIFGMASLIGCASDTEVSGVQASERLECQKVAPVDYDECLERARTGNVLHVPETVQQRSRRWDPHGVQINDR